jgi:hypothetical protein
MVVTIRGHDRHRSAGNISLKTQDGCRPDMTLLRRNSRYLVNPIGPQKGRDEIGNT